MNTTGTQQHKTAQQTKTNITIKQATEYHKTTPIQTNIPQKNNKHKKTIQQTTQHTEN